MTKTEKNIEKLERAKQETNDDAVKKAIDKRLETIKNGKNVIK